MILSLCMVVSLLPAISITASAISTSLSTVDMAQVYDPITNPLAISSADDLAYLAQQVNLGPAQTISYTDSGGSHTVTASTASYKLTSDIDLNAGITFNSDGTFSGGSPTQWTAIGNNSTAFSGTFDGGGYTISGIYILKTGTANSDAYQGLFGNVNNGTIKNINLTNGYIRGFEYIGGVAGYTSGTSTISNCYNSCRIRAGGTFTGFQIYAGGVAGYVDSATISNCGNTGIISADHRAGGIMGGLKGGTITSCHNTGSVSVNQNVGGIVGYAENAPTISNCYNTGSITGSDNGGIVGISFGATITSCYNIGSLSGTVRIGGVLGNNMGSTTLQYCYNTGSISGNLITGGIGGVVGYNTSGTCTVQNSYNAGGIITSGSGSGTVGGVAGGNAGGATVSATTCYYDKQMCPAGGIAGADAAGQAEGKLTAGMTGAGVFNDPLYWVTDTDIYPRLKDMDTTDAAYVSVTPVFLYDNSAVTPGDFEVSNAIGTGFSLGGAADSVSWASGSPSVISISGYNASVAGAGSAVFTATRNGVSRAVTLKVPGYAATVTVNKDGSTWTSGTPTIQLSTLSTSLSNAVSGTLSSGVYSFTGLNPTATYYVWNATSNQYLNQTVFRISPSASVNYYTVTLTKGTGIDSISGTGIDLAGSGIFLSGSNVSAWVTVSPGYSWSKWTQTIGGADVSTTQNYMIPTISSAITYTANAVLSPTYALTVNLNGGNGSTANGTHASGAAISIDAGTKSGYTFSSWTSSNGGTFANAASAATTFTMPGNATTIAAAWTQNSGGSGGGGGGGGGGSHTLPGTNITIGDENYTIGDENKDGTDTMVTVDQNKFDDGIEKAADHSGVIIPVSGNANITARLVVKNIEDMAKKEMTLTVQTGKISYNLDTVAVDTAKITAALGMTDTSKIPFDVKITNSNAVVNGTTVVLSPVEFTITATYNGKTATVNKFSSFVDRTIEITSDQAKKITTAVVVEENGSLRHVPTKVTVIDGKYYAVINSLTNSTYSVIWHPVEFSDLTAHWAKDTINDMGSRMVISGVGQGNFEPDREITRAEFAAIAVRALGLAPVNGTSNFADVSTSDWYCGYVKTAAEYGIITGYDAATFGPNDKITREQAMTMIARAMKITGLRSEIKESETTALIANYSDGTAASDYAKTNIAACLKSGMVTGRTSDTIAPKDCITRAEVAVIVQRLLQKSDLI